MKIPFEKILVTATLLVIAACTPEPKEVIPFPVNIVETEVTLGDNFKVFNRTIGLAHAESLGLEDGFVGRTADPDSLEATEMREKKKAFEAAARSPEARAKMRDFAAGILPKLFKVQTYGPMTGTRDAKLVVDATSYGVNMIGDQAIAFSPEDFQPRFNAGSSVRYSTFRGIATIVDPQTGDVLYGPYDNGAGVSYNPNNYSGNRAVEPQIDLITAYIDSVRVSARNQP
ncbi:MAG: hypothetical protein AAF503_14630 [Pseudomonadota bacterium]